MCNNKCPNRKNFIATLQMVVASWPEQSFSVSITHSIPKREVTSTKEELQRLLTDLRWTLLFALVQRDKLVMIATTTGVVEGHAFIIVPGKVPTGQLAITTASLHWHCAAR